MDIKKTIVATAAAAAVSASAFAETNDDYIKTFGMIMFERNGLAELQLTKAEFETFVSGMRASYEGKKLPDNINEFGQKMMEYLQKGKLVNGNVFDTTEKRGEPAQFNLGGVIPGFKEGLQKVGKGGKITLYIPSKLGYGEQALPGIPPNSTLVFDVEIIDVDPVKAEAPKAEAKADKK